LQGHDKSCPCNKTNNKSIFLISVYKKIFGETPLRIASLKKYSKLIHCIIEKSTQKQGIFWKHEDIRGEEEEIEDKGLIRIELPDRICKF
jgi:hypothetical protein